MDGKKKKKKPHPHPHKIQQSARARSILIFHHPVVCENCTKWNQEGGYVVQIIGLLAKQKKQAVCPVAF